MASKQKIEFTKMQGCGNDYVYINGGRFDIPMEEKPELVRHMSNRNFGIGSDGVIFINPVLDGSADFEMEMWNADGTRSEMCGNGMRCVGKYVYDKGLTDKERVAVVSAGQVKYLDYTIENGQVVQVKVNMGQPILQAAEVPVLSDLEQSIDEEIEVQGQTYRMTCVSMGNPHAVVFMDNVADLDIEAVGPYFENHKRFPRRTNTEFVKVIDRQTLEMRVWERGTGETLACGTGACATAVAAILNGHADNKVTVKLLGGDLIIEWDRETNLVYMTGPAVISFEGTIEI
jgi:diaminopimelate epimerase